MSSFSESSERSLGYAVREIITPIDDLVLWSDDPLMQQDALQNRFITHFPVRVDGKITGMVRREGEAVGAFMPLTAEWLIAADTPILHLIDLFDQNADRVFLVLQSSQIIGLVAPADLNKIPARASIYLLTAQFEDKLAKLVRRTLNEDEVVLEQLLSAENMQKVREEHAKAKASDLGLSLYYFLYLADLMTLAAKHPDLRARLKLRSRSHADAELRFTELRNRVSHPSGLLIKSRAELGEINLACSKIIRLSMAMKEHGL